MGILTFFIRLFGDLSPAAGPDVLWDKAAVFLLSIDTEPQAVIRQNPALRNATPFIKKHIDHLCRNYLLPEGAAMTEQATEFLAQTKKIIESVRIFPVKEIL